MARPAFDRLSFLDSTFLIAESTTNHMHVAGTATYEAGPLRCADGGIDIERIRDYVSSRLHAIPRYRQVLAFTPIEGHPVWVDDQHFNIAYHVRHTALPRPGDVRQLKRLSGRVMSQQLDRSKPLWEMWVVEGLEGGDRFAIITKIHHCMVDGMSSVDLLEVLLTPESTNTIEPTPRWIPRPVPTTWELLRAETVRRASLPLETLSTLRQSIRRAQDPRSDIRAMLRAVRDTVWSGLRTVSDTPLNQPIGTHRRLDWLEMSLDEVKEVKNRLGGTLNDIVLTTVTGAMQRFLEDRRVNVEGLDFRVMAPVSVRTSEERGTMGNRVSAWVVDLPIAERDPRRRLEAIREATTRLKESKQALGAEMLTQVMSWTPSTLLSLGSRMVTRRLPFNLVVTNVPGPQVPLYMLGARMLDNFGQVPLTDYLGLGIVLFSYAGKLCWGFTADWDLMPDLHEVVKATEAAFQELRAAAAETTAAESAGASRRPVRAVASRRGGSARRDGLRRPGLRRRLRHRLRGAIPRPPRLACWCRTTDMTALADRLAAVSSRSTCRLTHRGRKSGNPYEVTIWFLVDGETVYLATANASRQWVRNVQANPSISFGVGGETFTGTSERVRDAAEERHVMDLVAAKYWYLWPLVGLARLLGYDPKPDASFRVRLAT